MLFQRSDNDEDYSLEGDEEAVAPGGMLEQLRSHLVSDSCTSVDTAMTCWYLCFRVTELKQRRVEMSAWQLSLILAWRQ